MCTVEIFYVDYYLKVIMVQLVCFFYQNSDTAVKHRDIKTKRTIYSVYRNYISPWQQHINKAIISHHKNSREKKDIIVFF